jgi:glycosyltransferase involved in cell wall biosynthesis
MARLRYERGDLVRWAVENAVRAIIMLNGQTIPGCPIPVLAHNQDPWPYRPEAWNGLKDRLIAFIKRREHKRGLRSASVYGWTSNYLRDLVCGWHRVKPAVDGVFYNGLPDAWIERARLGTSVPIDKRPMQIVTVSNVSIYKRQDLVVRAVAALRRVAGLESLTYRVIGHGEAGDLERVRTLARDLGVQHAVTVEGRVSGERVTQAMGESRAFVLMSVCESFGLPAIEAMTFGTPVVVSACCAHPEVCGDGAALVREDDLGHLVETLKRVLLDVKESEAMAVRGRARAQEFAWATTVGQMLGHLDRIVGDDGRGK